MGDEENERHLMTLKRHWRRHVLHPLHSEWIRKNKDELTQQQINQIELELYRTYLLLDAITVDSRNEFLQLMQKFNLLCRLINYAVV
jgi:hypothetical protein